VESDESASALMEVVRGEARGRARQHIGVVVVDELVEEQLERVPITHRQLSGK
jgi:hypothetical protein